MTSIIDIAIKWIQFWFFFFINKSIFHYRWSLINNNSSFCINKIVDAIDCTRSINTCYKQKLTPRDRWFDLTNNTSMLKLAWVKFLLSSYVLAATIFFFWEICYYLCVHTAYLLCWQYELWRCDGDISKSLAFSRFFLMIII